MLHGVVPVRKKRPTSSTAIRRNEAPEHGRVLTTFQPPKFPSKFRNFEISTKTQHFISTSTRLAQGDGTRPWPMRGDTHAFNVAARFACTLSYRSGGSALLMWLFSCVVSLGLGRAS
jgi:hypothetical protein